MSRTSGTFNFQVINDARWLSPVPGWRAYRCLVRLLPEAVGGYSVYAPALPGACSQGETVAETLANIKEALAGVLLAYLDAGQPIPWVRDIGACPAGELERWVIVRVPTGAKGK